MSTRQKKTGKSAKTVAKKIGSHAGARVKHARAVVKQAPSRARRFLSSTAVRVLVGASAVALVLAKVKQHLS